jgi:hypothetical protein
MRPVWSGQRAQHSSVHACIMLRWAEDCAGKYACTKTRIDGWIDWLPLSQLCRERAVVVHRYHAPLRVLLLHPAQPDCLGARLAQHLVRSLQPRPCSPLASAAPHPPPPPPPTGHAPAWRPGPIMRPRTKERRAGFCNDCTPQQSASADDRCWQQCSRARLQEGHRAAR